MLPISIETTATAASAGCHVSTEGSSATSNSRTKTQNAAALVATDMNAVTGVGAPSYTSGVHWWNGASETLNASPVAASAIPIRTSGSSASPRSAIPSAIAVKSVDPEAPYMNASPYSSVADPTEPTIRYLS